EIALLVGSAWLGASALCARLLPRFSGAPAQLAAAVLTLALLLWTAELLGTIGLLKALPYLLCVAVVGLALRFGLTRSSLSPAGGVGDAATTGPAAEALDPAPLVSFAIANVAFLHFAA